LAIENNIMENYSVIESSQSSEANILISSEEDRKENHQYHGKELRYLPKIEDCPHGEFVGWHNENVYRVRYFPYFNISKLFYLFYIGYVSSKLTFPIRKE